MLNNEKNIDNRMMKWRNENDGMEDDRRVMKNKEIIELRKRVKMRDCLNKRE